MSKQILIEKQKETQWNEIRTSEDLQEDIDLVKLKLELLVEGLRLHESAREGIGTLYKERVVALFDIYINYQKGITYPAELVLPSSPDKKPEVDALGTLEDGLTVAYRNNDYSPFQLRRESGKLILEREDNYLTEVAFYPRPAYYTKKTSDGIPLNKFVIHGGLQGLFGCISSSWCNYFKNGDQCRFCNLVPTYKEYKEEIIGRKSVEPFAEAVAGAWEDGICRRLVITGGILPGRKELESYKAIIKAIKESRDWADKDSIPIMPVIGAPEPDSHNQLKEIKEAGSRFIATNLEMGSPDWFRAVCPGKHKNGGWENWVAALEHEAEIFGFGNVRSNLVAGIEPMQDTLSAIKHLTDSGVWCFVSTPWCPDPGSILEGHRNPPAEWYWRLNNSLADIWQNSKLTIEGLSIIPGANDILPFDIWRIREGKTVPELGSILKNEAT
jgi:hypothetical protein